jgi:hypothetical protein
VESAAALASAREELRSRSADFGITAIEDMKETAEGQSFLLSDLNRNWWEIAYLGN